MLWELRRAKVLPELMIDIQYIRTSTLLLRWDGLTILTDPWFAMHMRGLPVFVRPCLRPEELPPLDLVLVSHLHPDHFDSHAMRRLAHRAGLLLGPPGIIARARGVSARRLVAASDGDTVQDSGFSVHTYQVQHSGYENAYVVRRGGTSLLFAGDARYSPVFRAMGQDHAPTVSLLPVGGTLILGRRIVMGPEDAARAAMDLGTRVVVPIHNGGEWMSVPPLSRHPGRASQLVDLARERNAPFSVAPLRPGQRVGVTSDGALLPPEASP